MPSSVNRARTAFLVVAALLAFGPSPVQIATDLIGSGGPDPAAAAELPTADIDPLTAESDAVVTTLRDLDEAVRERTDAVAAAKEAQSSAAADLESAIAERAEAEERVTAVADGDTADETVEPPSTGAFPLLRGRSLTTGSIASSTRVDEAHDDLDDATQREHDATAAADDRAEAAEDAATALAEAEALEAEFMASVEDRVDAKLADAEAVEPTDPTAAETIRADEEAIAGSIDEITEARRERRASAEDAGAAESEEPAAASKPAARKPAAAKPAPAAPKPAPAPSPPPLPDPTGSASGVLAGVWCSDLVHQIVVDGSIGGNVQALVNDAYAGGVGLCAKSGFRPYAEQVELRKANCGGSDYAIFQAPPSTCSPPTARPGTSNHEDGLAIDFSCADGQPMTHASPCYQWLAAHAGAYGLHNLPSEPWHWSVTGR